MTVVCEVVESIQDARRYRWLTKAFSEGRETYIGESATSKEQVDKYIDSCMEKESGIE